MKKKIAVTILSAGLLGGMVADSPVRAAEPSEALKLAQQLNQAFVEVAESVSKSVVVVRVASKPRAREIGRASCRERVEISVVAVS